MPFTIKSEIKSKCDGCVHAMIVQPARDVEKVTMCNLLNNMAVGRILECNQFLPHVYAPIPSRFMVNAWSLTPDKDKKQVGFKPPQTVVKNE